MPSNEFRTLKRKEQEGREEKRERETGRGKKDQTEGREKESTRETVLISGIVSFLLPSALIFSYCSGLRKTDLS